MKRILLIAALLLATLAAGAQSRDHAWEVGVRGGLNLGALNAKYYLNDVNSVEGSVSIPYADNGISVLGIYEWNYPVIADGFDFFYGIGGKVGQYSHVVSNGSTELKFNVGVIATVGLQYQIPEIPIVFSLDYRAHMNIGGPLFALGDVALGVRFCF